MDTVFLWILGVLLVPLIFGSYGFSILTYSWLKASIKDLWTEVERLKDNDIKHLEDRVKKLEDEQ